MALDNTIGGSSSNSYGDEAGADAYFTEHLESEIWSVYDKKLEALLYAAMYLDVMFTWLGSKATSSQAMEWPRSGLTYYTTSEIPAWLIKAQYELAIWFAKKGVPTAKVDLGRIKANTFELEMRQTGANQPPELVIGLVSEYGTIRQIHGSVVTPKLFRV